MAKIQNDKWYAWALTRQWYGWALTPELRVLSNEEGQDYASLDHKHAVAFDTKEEATRRLKNYPWDSWWWKADFENRVGTGKELTVELVKNKMRRSRDG